MTHTTKELHQPGTREAETTQGGVQFTPRIDIVEYESEMVLTADLPGVTPDSLDIQYEEGQLTLHGKVLPRVYGKQCRLAEYEVGDFYRSFRIGEMIDTARISADLKNGILTLRLPKVQKVKSRRVKIKLAPGCAAT